MDGQTGGQHLVVDLNVIQSFAHDSLNRRMVPPHVAGEWKGKPVRPSSEWIMAHVPIPVKEYEELARRFNPTEFDAERWVRMAEDAGMKYIVITAKHGDGSDQKSARNRTNP